jgi:hypothetical protein
VPAAAAAAARARPAYVALAIVVARFGAAGGGGAGGAGLQAELAWQVLSRRCLAPGLAQLVAVRVPLGGLPAAAGAEGDLASLKDAWLPSSALLMPGAPGAPRSAGMGVGVAAAPEAGGGGGGGGGGGAGAGAPPALAEVDIDSASLSLKDPLTMAPIRVPVRGDLCRHRDCLDLHTYLRHNLSGAGQWACTRCRVRLLPQDLYLDSMQLALLQGLERGERSGSVRAAVDRAEFGAQRLVAWAKEAPRAAPDCSFRVELARDGTWAQQTLKRGREGGGRSGSPSSASASASASASSSSSVDDDDEDRPPWDTNPNWGKGEAGLPASLAAGAAAAAASRGSGGSGGRGGSGGGGGGSRSGGGGGGGSGSGSVSGGGGGSSGGGGRAKALAPRVALQVSSSTGDDDVIILGPDVDFIDLTAEE